LEKEFQLAEEAYQNCWRANMEKVEESKHKTKALGNTRRELNEVSGNFTSFIKIKAKT